MFVHGFVSVPVPLDVALPRLGGLLNGGLSRLLSSSWAEDIEDWIDAGLSPRDLVLPEPLSVNYGSLRFHDAVVVVPLSWEPPPARLVPAGEADLEVAGRGSGRTDLRMLASMTFGAGVDPWSTEGGLARRAASSALRRFLEDLSRSLGRPVAAPAGLPGSTRILPG